MCAICDLRIEFAIEHPLSLSVAVATRRAIDAGALPNPVVGEGGPTDATLLRVKAVGSLRAVQRRIEHSLARDEFLRLPDFFVLMIESRTWGFFHATVDGFDPACRREPPRPFASDAIGGAAVVLAAETAMQQALFGKLPFKRAAAHGLIEIDAEEGEAARLRSALNAAFPKIGLSSFALPAPRH